MLYDICEGRGSVVSRTEWNENDTLGMQSEDRLNLDKCIRHLKMRSIECFS